MLKNKSLIITAFVFALLLGVLLPLSQIAYSWSNWKPATCMPDMCFCEAQRPGTIVQPANTWSSLGFVLVGVLILSTRLQFGPNNIAAKADRPLSTTHALVYGAAVIFTGLGSTFYHASLTFLGQFFDVMGMYLLAVFIVLYHFSQVRQIRPAQFVSFYILLNLVLAVLLVVLPELRRYLFAGLILVALALAYQPRGVASKPTRSNYLAKALFALLLAFIFFLLDLTKTFCWPESWLQGHALWHIGGALAAGLLYEHYHEDATAE